MEFKGTKGKWKVLVKDGRGSPYFSIESDNIRICNINSKRIEQFKEEEANAQLIAHAPEMLEMLSKVLEVNKHHGFNGHLINEQINDLLTRSTTI